ncbi:hypothetical protein [Pseudonocardia sp. T1-2H]|uniref:hypothetical protein n=1 Tax=Pseudonocardia sp. T1-2H TaxID=3128899 RepID=UPI003100FA60
MPSGTYVNGQVNGAAPQSFEVAPFGETLVLEADRPEASEATPARADSPFLNEYFAADTGSDVEADAPDPRASEAVELLAELHDAEFDEVVGELVQDAAEAYAEQYRFETADDATGPVAERFLSEYLAPLQERAQALVEQVADAAAEHDPAAMTEEELDGFLSRFEVADTGMRPAFENFLGGFGRKLAGVVKKGVQLAGRFLPISAILRKLASLPFVRALVKKVLRFALGQLPPQLRPAARQLAARLLRKATAQELDEYGETDQPAGPAVGLIQEEFDVGVATLLLARDELESEVALVGMADTERGEGDPLGELHAARERFIAEVGALGEGQDATQATERFVPALLPVLRFGLRLARPKVVAALSRHVARMIQPYVGAQSRPLARAIVDAGLRMLSLEASEETETHVAGTALAGTVEDTVRRMTELDEAVLDSETLLEAAVAEAFDEAAAANFPPELIRPELRETELPGTWVLLPTQGRPFYRGFTHVAPTRITPQLARAVRTFGGGTLADVLRDRYGITGPVEARMRMYQAVPGTALARVVRAEREVPQLDEMSLHPLTTQAAGMLLREPGLGRDVAPEYLAGPDVIADGQRFYHLEIPSAAASTPAARRRDRQRRPRSTGLSVRVTPGRDEVRVRLYLSETDAQELATALGQGPAGARRLTRLLLRRVDAGLRAVLRGRAPGRVRIVHEAVPEDHLTGRVAQRRPQVRRWLAGWLPAALHRAVTDRFAARHGRQFTEALANPADGVTVRVTFRHPPGLARLTHLLRGGPVPPATGPTPAPADAVVEILPGFSR